MITRPQPHLPEAVQFVYVEPARFADHGQESQGAEVERVVGLVVQYAEANPNKSLGVIALGINHAKRIQAVLDGRLESRPDLAEFFRLGKKEEFFVKNLERVQGDERDAIILSVGYGQDRTGTLSHNFGPINKEGGERRLNVAVTRAKERMTIVASFRPEDLDPNKTKGGGPKLLRKYLEFAASGGTNLGDGGGSDVPENMFERRIREALEKTGMKLVPQYGASKYRLDLVVQHPEVPGRFVMAIECDGATYHSSVSARDRDQLRQTHLEAMGWTFHRIWSTDWFLRRDEEIARAVQAYQKALERPGRSASLEPASPSAPPPAESSPVQTRLAPPLIDREDNIDQYPHHKLVEVIRWLQSDGCNYPDDDLIREATQYLGFSRVGAKIRERLLRAIRSAGSSAPRPEKSQSDAPILLRVLYSEKDEAKALGARWDNDKRAWYVPAGMNPTPFRKWIPMTV